MLGGSHTHGPEVPGTSVDGHAGADGFVWGCTRGVLLWAI